MPLHKINQDKNTNHQLKKKKKKYVHFQIDFIF